MTAENVYLFVPNVIGYIRIILALLSFYFMPTDYILASCCYIISGLLDAVDGRAARYFKQASKLGSFLDMLTDRCATMCLLAVLGTFYQKWLFAFQMIMIIDIASHWIHCQSSLLKGADSHKKIDLADNIILRHYYSNTTILFCMCSGNEMFFSMLYLLHFTLGPVFSIGPISFGLFTFLCVLSAPVALLKTTISLIQLFAACQNVVSLDVAERNAEKNK